MFTPSQRAPLFQEQTIACDLTRKQVVYCVGLTLLVEEYHCTLMFDQPLVMRLRDVGRSLVVEELHEEELEVASRWLWTNHVN